MYKRKIYIIYLLSYGAREYTQGNVKEVLGTPRLQKFIMTHGIQRF